jgi:uncharacterized membrane protein YqjE
MVPSPVLSATDVMVRHLDAYATLVSCDVALARKRVARQVLAGATLCIAITFVMALACVGVIATWWDTPARLSAVYALLCPFAAIALIAAGALFGSRRSGAFFGNTGAELRKDRHVIDELLVHLRSVDR